MPIKPYDHTTYPSNGALGSSTALRNELDAIETGFDMVATEIETALTGSETAAVTAVAKAAEALTSANNADISEAAAAASAAAALVSKNAAAASEAATTALALQVANTYDSFDDRYLGAKAAAPTLDNDGNALQVGTLYFDTVLVTLRGYNGAAWVNLPATTASNVTNVPAGNLSAITVQAALNELDADLSVAISALSSHLADTDDAHDASAISSVPAGNLTANTVQAALNELQADVDTRALNSGLTTANTNLANHLADTDDAHDASAISYAGNTSLIATNVEAALDELDNEKLALAGGTLTGALNEAQGANIASAGTVNLTTATGNYVHITGTTTITAVTLAQGAERTVVFDGALTLANGASLLLPTAANITTAAGDTAVFRGEASSVVRCIDYIRKSGSPLVAGADASSTVKGVVELATSAEIKTGTDTTRAIVPSELLTAIGFTANYLSAAQTITSAGALTLAHGLGRKPVLTQLYIKNTTTEANYSVGDEILIAPFFDNGSTLFGCSIVPDTTNLNIRFSNAGNFMIVPNKSTGARTVLTNANWRLYVRAWA